MKWILIDASWLAYRVRYGNKSSVGIMEDANGFLFGLLDSIRTICHDPNVYSYKIGMFLDSSTSNRKKLYPDYKKSRSEKSWVEREEDDVMRNFLAEFVSKICPKIGIPTYMQEGFEADDLIASAAIGLTKRKRQGIILTADADLYQCITEQVTWYNPVRLLYYDYNYFCAEMGILPSAWACMKSYAGCSTDCVPGVGGVGEKTALRYLRGELPGHHKIYQKIENFHGTEDYLRNRQLVTLPFAGTDPIRCTSPNFRIDGFRDVCRRYQFDAMLEGKRWADWKMILQSKMKNPVEARVRNRGDVRG